MTSEKVGITWVKNNVTVAEPELLQMYKSEADAAGGNWQDWNFGQLGAAIDDWEISDVLDQAISEARQTKP